MNRKNVSRALFVAMSIFLSMIGPWVNLGYTSTDSALPFLSLLCNPVALAEALPLVTALDPANVQAAGTNTLVDDFEDNDSTNLWGGWWYTYDDAGADGNSVITPAAGDTFTIFRGGAHNSDFAAKITWTLGRGAPFPFVGAITELSNVSGRRVDISAYTGVSFYIKTTDEDPMSHIMKLAMDTDATQNGFASYDVEFTPTDVWTRVSFTWDDFALPDWSPNSEEDYPLDLTRIIHLDFAPATAYSGTDSGELWIDNVAFIN